MTRHRHRHRHHQRKWRGVGLLGAVGCRFIQVVCVLAGLYSIISNIIQIIRNLNSLDWFWIRAFGFAQYALWDHILWIVGTIILCVLVIWFMQFCYEWLKHRYYR